MFEIKYKFIERKEYDILPEHCREGMILYIEYGVIPGSFLTAVIENDLVHSFAYADDINIKRLFDYAGFLYNECPSQAWGSKEKVAAWAKARKAEYEESRKEEEKDGSSNGKD